MKLKLTLGLIAGILGLGGCATTIPEETTQRLQHAASMHSEFLRDHQGRPLSRGAREAIDHYGKKARLLNLVYEGLFYKATFDLDGDNRPDYFMMGRWLFNNGKKVPATDFFLACHVTLGDSYINQNYKVEPGKPNVSCHYRGRPWVTPQYVADRLSGVDIFTTDKMRKEK